MSGGNVKVVARFRPPNSAELALNSEIAVQLDETNVRLRSTETMRGPESAGFAFDRVFGMDTRQQDVFLYGVQDTVDDVLNGFNGTIFAYGQTGSGKTYTMMGADIDDADGRGLIPRITDQIFTSILTSSATELEFTVKASYLEIYNERIRDLLEPVRDNLPIHEDKAQGVYIKGLSEFYVSTPAEVYEMMRRGGAARAVSATNMNAESSRSHSIFVIKIVQRNLETGSQKTGNLYLVDLAGSEKIAKTGASGQTLEEAKKINKSLSALGMVINALTDGKSTHIPYRDSKLTRILQESLGGNSRTTLIINCSPVAYNEAETLSTLRFGMRAKSIKNRARVNAELSTTELKALLKKAEREADIGQAYIAQLEREVAIWRSGGRVEPADYAQRGVVPASVASAVPSRMATPSTPSRPFSPATPSRPDTPSASVDEREEFLRRENELSDQVAEQEAALAAADAVATNLRSELSLAQREAKLATTELADVRGQLERVTFEAKEAAIVADGMREHQAELANELDEMRRQLELRSSSAAVDADKDRRRAEKMAALMGTFENERENEIRATLAQTDDVALLRSIASDQQDRLRSHADETAALVRRRDELEGRLAAMEAEYEDLLAQSADGHELRLKLESQYAAKRDQAVQEATELRQQLDARTAESRTLAAQVDALRHTNDELKRALAATAASVEGGKDLAESARDLERIRQTMTAQLGDFDVMKKALMKDLQDRCEKVVELEISLDETREQYNNVLRNSNSKAQQRKMDFLTRNLDQLTLVQRQLVDQNASLKKDTQLAERKLIARNERIEALELQFADAQKALRAQQAQFERQVADLQARATISNSSIAPSSSFSFGRIAKPLRGGGGAKAAPDEPAKSKSSWFFAQG